MIFAGGLRRDVTAATRDPWRAAAWLLLLAPLFYASYGFSNWLAAQNPEVGSAVFGWERRIPFLAWTIIPYWSINLFYGASLFLCATRDELDIHGRRLLTAQLIAVACFIFFPLRLAVAKPETDGLFGFLFDTLAGFDRPYNQAPSLHIALLVILWDLYARYVPKRFLWLLHGWCLLIGVSVLTTYQHHFIDVPTGALLGLFCLWLWPEVGASPFADLRFTADRRRRRIGAIYLLAALVFAASAAILGGVALWLFWPAASLLLVAAIYLAIGPVGFQKDAAGRMSLAARLLLAPYLAGARLNAWLWTRRSPEPQRIAENIWIGRLSDQRRAAAQGFAAIVDLCAELPAPDSGLPYFGIPMLDLVTPEPARLRRAVGEIEARNREGPVLVTCALGFGRSAVAVAAWLLATGRMPSAAAAASRLRLARPGAVVTSASLAEILNI